MGACIWRYVNGYRDGCMNRKSERWMKRQVDVCGQVDRMKDEWRGEWI
jgi:hypothetical protein